MTIGLPLPRREDEDLIRGRGRYTDDAARADDVVMVFVRSDRPAGRLVRLDPTAALAIDGVLGVLTAEDLRAAGFSSLTPRMRPTTVDGASIHIPPFPGLADGAVRHVGDPIAAVLAVSETVARAAAEAVVVEIEDAPFVVDVVRAVHGPSVWAEVPDNRVFVHELGDRAAVDAAMASAAHVVTERLSISRVTAVTMEPRSARAWIEPDGTVVVMTGTQAPHGLQHSLAAAAQIPVERVRVITDRCGGSFGMRNSASPELVVLVLAALRLKRPVRWTETRSEAFLADPQAREQIVDARLALDGDGRFLGLQVAATVALGAYLGPSTLHSATGNLGSLAGVYRTPAIHAQVTGVHLNTQSVAPYRGAGRPEATYILERMIDLAAARCGFDRIALRRHNMIEPHEMPYRTPLVFTYDCGDFPGLLDEALARVDWAGFPDRRAQAQARGRLRGIGLAYAIEIAGGPVTGPAPEYARIDVSPEGFILSLGTGDAGQGHATTFLQVLDTQLGLKPEGGVVVAGDTGRVARGTGTFGSRSAAAAGSALTIAALALRDKLIVEAAEHLEASAADIEFTRGAFRVVGTDRTVTTAALIRVRGLTLTEERFIGTAAPTFPNGCHVAEVEIDPETGALEIVRYLVVDDVGIALNPLLVKGQIHGGVVQGIGQVVMEAIRYDAASGQLTTGSLMDYAVPRAGDVPALEVVMRPVPTAANILGVKGAGEAGTVGALPVIASAVADALSPLGIDHVDMPITPARLWAVIEAAKNRRG